MNSTRTFLYHAHGSALGGYLRRPFNEAIEAQASAALPIAGGHGSARAENFNHRDMVSFKTAYTQVSGSYNPQDDTYTTLVSAVVEGLNILDVVTADRVVARLSSERKLDDDETRVIATGTQIVNLRVAGHPVELELDTETFANHDTYAGLKSRYQQDAAFRQSARRQFLWGDLDNTAPDFLKQRYNWHKQADTLLESNGMVPCSLVKRVACGCPELKAFGNVLKLPQFGTIHVADLLVAPHRRHLTALRFELGSPTEGSLAVGGIEGNGSGFP
jgi:hypothetical protein